MNFFSIIVDPYISSSHLYDALVSKGITPIAILTDLISREEQLKRFPKDKFTYHYHYNNPDLIEILSSFNIVSVIAGYEASLSIADELVNLFCPKFANNPQTTSCRNNKYDMQERLKQKGLNSVKQLKVKANEGLTEEELKILKNWNWPLISKPIKGIASYSVKRNQNIDQLKANLEEIKNTNFPLNYSKEEIVIQECLEGLEYFVDTVSLNGNHVVTGVFRYKKTLYDNYPIYRYAEIIDCNSEEAVSCINYVKSVLTAVDLNNGMAHTELFLTERGPYLIEINPRISGASGYPNKLSQLANRRDQANLIAESIIQPDAFINNYNFLPSLSCYGLFVLIQTWKTESMANFKQEKLTTLPSFKDLTLWKSLNEIVHKPTHLLSTIGILLLAHSDMNQIKKDYEKFLEWETSGALFSTC